MSINNYEFTGQQWSDFISKLLVKGGWNQSALCRELNKVAPEKSHISASTVGNWVRKEEDGGEPPSMPSVENMGRVAKLLQISLPQLIEAVQNGDDPKVPSLGESVIPALELMARAGDLEKSRMIDQIRSRMPKSEISSVATTLFRLIEQY